ncbi:transient receptor potential cation channel subfamily M member 3-like [Ixodes scapularis]
MPKKTPSSSSLNRSRWPVAEQTHHLYQAEDRSSRYLCGKGTIHFWKNFAFESEGRPYIRVTHDIGIEEVLNVFTREWKFTLPRIVLVIISSLTTWQEWSAPRQLENFKAGLIKAANTTAMWIMTNGVNTGIAKEVGAWVNEELVQRLIMRCHRHPHTDFEKMPPLCLLGIVREDLLTCADKFDANKDGAIFIENVGSRPEENRFDLNPDHTHFIVVKDDTVNKTGLNYFMLKLEQHLSMTCEDDSASTLRHGCVDPRTLCSAEIPLIAVVCQGGTGCNKMVLEHIKKQLPILVIQGSGGVADLLALAYNEIDRRGVTLWDPEFIENVLKPELSSRICQMFPKFRDNAISRNVFKDRIVECLRLACQTQEQMYFTVINIHHHRNNLQHLDDILLKAVFKSQLKQHQAHQMKKDLLLTLDWNCPHVAMTKIDREDFEYALLRPKREEFLHIFLNQGFQVHKYLSPKRLRQLFVKIQHEEFFRSVCWEGALGRSLLSKIGKNFIEVDLNWLIETTTGLRDFVDPEELSMNTALGMYIQDAASAERKALVMLSLWAAFSNRRKTAEVLWRNCDQPVHLALLISMTYEKLTLYVYEGTIKQELLDTSRGVTLWDPEFIENVLKPELSSRICQMFPKFRDNAISRNVFKDRIVECLRLACQTQEQMYFTVINIHHHRNNLQHLDDILLKAVFKSQLKQHQAHQMKKDLLLTLDWNCPHVAMTKVFSKDSAQQYQASGCALSGVGPLLFYIFQIDREDFEYALLRPKREEFLHIFLNQGFQVHKYLSPKRLRQLFVKIQHEEFFRSVCWEGALGRSLLSKIGKNFIEVDLNWLIETTTGLRDFVDPEELSMNTALGMYIQDAASAERKALVMLSLWAAFSNRRKTAEVLWRNCDQPVHLALLISMTYEKLTLYVYEGTIKQELLDTSRQFAALATGVLDLCYRDSTCRAYDILSVQSVDWKHKTAVDIAAEAENRTFLAHPCCQKWLTNQFLGRISVRDITWGVLSVPLWLKIILCAFTVLPMYLWVRFKSDPHQMDYGDDEECEKDYSFSRNVTENVKYDRYDTVGTGAQEGIFIQLNPPLWKMVYLMWNAPITKFWVYQIFYVMFLGTFSVAVLWPSCGNMTLDIVTVFWIFLIAMETIDRTYRLHLTNMHVPLISKCVEVFVTIFFGVMYAAARLLGISLFRDPYNGKVLICVGLLYFYYRQTLIYLPISPQLGPLLYRVKLMVMRDFANFMRMALLVIISGGIVTHAILYPDFPISVELFRRIFHKAWFSLFLTPIDDLEGNSACYSKSEPERNACYLSRCES